MVLCRVWNGLEVALSLAEDTYPEEIRVLVDLQESGRPTSKRRVAVFRASAGEVDGAPLYLLNRWERIDAACLVTA